MSTFEGRLQNKLFHFIAIDCFTEANYSASAFFLSHMHSDHMVGLFKDSFSELFMVDREKKFYCSEISKKLLELHTPRFAVPKEQIVALQTGESTVISRPPCRGDCGTYEKSALITVTLIPTAHILGSVMFLFECEDVSSLYTGDFRIQVDDVDKLKLFHDMDGNIKQITDLHLDTTFACKQYPRFPTRSSSINEITWLAKSWLDSSASNMVALTEVPKFGNECLILDLSKSLETKILVRDEMYEYYKYIPEMDTAVISYLNYDELRAKRRKTYPPARLGRIHACKTYKFCEVCQSIDVKYLRRIKPCAMSFTNFQGHYVRWNKNSNVIKVVYSTHCSLEELLHFISYLKPKNIYPSVCGLSTKEKILHLLQPLAEPVAEPPALKMSTNEIISKESTVKYDSNSEHEESSKLMDSPPW